MGHDALKGNSTLSLALGRKVASLEAATRLLGTPSVFIFSEVTLMTPGEAIVAKRQI